MKGALDKLFCSLRNKPIVLFTCLKSPIYCPDKCPNVFETVLT